MSARRLSWLVGCLLVGIAGSLSWFLATQEGGAAKRESEFRALLKVWGSELKIPTPYEVVNFRGPGAIRDDASSKCFRLRLKKGQAQVLLDDEEFVRKFVVRRREKVPPRMNVPWWKAGPEATCFTGRLEAKERSELLIIYIVSEPEYEWLLIESLTTHHP